MIYNINPATNKGNLESTLTFTRDQRIAYDELIEFINSPWNEDDYKRALIGPAGTGKTFLVRALIKNCKLSYSVIGLSAPTHKACRVLNEAIHIGGVKINTLQSDLGLRVNFNMENFDINHPPFDPRGKIKIDNYSIYIVDEASMINRGLAIFLEKTCKSNACKILYIGDASQLPPVGERYSSAFRGVKSYTLKEIVRQEEDNPVKPLLDILRKDIDNKTFNFLGYIQKVPSYFDDSMTKGYAVLPQQDFERIMYNNFNDPQLTTNVDFAKVVAFTNPCVSSWNKFIRNAIIQDSDKSIITKHDLIISYTTIVNKFNEAVIKNSEDYILYEVVNYVHPRYELNGFLVRFTSIHGGITTTPLFIVDHKDRYSIQKYLQIANNLINEAKTSNSKVRAQKWREYYEFKESCLLLIDIVNRNGEKLYTRDLDYGFALTSHKSQGSTFDTVFVDVNDIVFDKYGNMYSDVDGINRRLYVACSRCKNKLYLRYGR